MTVVLVYFRDLGYTVGRAVGIKHGHKCGFPTVFEFELSLIALFNLEMLKRGMLFTLAKDRKTYI